MTATYHIGTGLFKKSLNEALVLAATGDHLLLDPGHYAGIEKVDGSGLTIVGTGSSPQETVLQSQVFLKKSGTTVTLKNLTLDVDGCSLSIEHGAKVIAENCVIMGNKEKVAVFLSDQALGQFSQCTVKARAQGIGGNFLLVNKKAVADLKNCEIVGIAIKQQGQVKVNRSRVSQYLSLKDQSIMNGNAIIFDNFQYVNFKVTSGSQLKLDDVRIAQATLRLKVEHGLCEFTSSNCSPDHRITYTKDTQSTVNIANAVEEHEKEGA